MQLLMGIDIETGGPIIKKTSSTGNWNMYIPME